jgi:hypothetical protein
MESVKFAIKNFSNSIKTEESFSIGPCGGL